MQPKWGWVQWLLSIDTIHIASHICLYFRTMMPANRKCTDIPFNNLLVCTLFSSSRFTCVSWTAAIRPGSRMGEGNSNRYRSKKSFIAIYCVLWAANAQFITILGVKCANACTFSQGTRNAAHMRVCWVERALLIGVLAHRVHPIITEK